MLIVKTLWYFATAEIKVQSLLLVILEITRAEGFLT